MTNENHSVSSMVESAIGKIKEVLDSEISIGKAVELPNGGVAIPVCKVSFGFGSGGGDIEKKATATSGVYGGGIGGGISVTPIAFLVCEASGNIKMLQLDTIGTTADNIVRTVPDIVDKITGIISDSKAKGKQVEK